MAIPSVPREHPPPVPRRGCPGQYGQPHRAGGCRCLLGAAPTHQFARSLAAIGWPLRVQGRLLGCRYSRNFRVLTYQRIERGTALRVGWLYARLVAGIYCPRTTTDRDQAVRVLTAHGRHTVSGIATRLGMSVHTVRAIQHQGGWALDPADPIAALAS